MRRARRDSRCASWGVKVDIDAVVSGLGVWVGVEVGFRVGLDVGFEFDVGVGVDNVGREGEGLLLPLLLLSPRRWPAAIKVFSPACRFVSTWWRNRIKGLS